MLGSEPAFACSKTEYDFGQTGLSKRELFAAMAMQGLLANLEYQVRALEKPESSTRNIAEFVAFGATDYADALLAELAKEARDGK